MKTTKMAMLLGMAITLWVVAPGAYADSTGCSDGATALQAESYVELETLAFQSQYAVDVAIPNSSLTGIGPGAATADDPVQTLDHFLGRSESVDNNGNIILCVKAYSGNGQNKAGFWVHFTDDGGGSTSKWMEE